MYIQSWWYILPSLIRVRVPTHAPHFTVSILSAGDASPPPPSPQQYYRDTATYAGILEQSGVGCRTGLPGCRRNSFKSIPGLLKIFQIPSLYSFMLYSNQSSLSPCLWFGQHHFRSDEVLAKIFVPTMNCQKKICFPPPGTVLYVSGSRMWNLHLILNFKIIF